jgi:thiol:disulfide interchange protein
MQLSSFSSRANLSLLLRAAVVTAVIGALTAVAPSRSIAGGDWNESGIAWKTYEEGLAEAKKANKPILLIFYTEWCPHCTNYSKLFHDPKVVEQAKQFVMVRVDNDKNKDLGKKYAPDGGYIPRTFFLTSDGTLDPDLHEERDQYKYFYNESSATGILAGMDRALAKLKKS